MNEEQTQPREVKREFPKPVLTREQWAECRRAVEAGMEMREASERFGVDYQCVKVRAWREKWLHDSRIKTLAEEIKAKEAAKVAKVLPAVTEGAKPALQTAEALAVSLESYRSRTILGLAKLAEKGVSKAVSADLPVENWQDAKIAAEIAMKLHQVGQESVQVNICNAFADMGEGQLIETDAEIVGDDEGEEGRRDAYFVD